MVVKLIQDYEFRGVPYKKGATVAMTRADALNLCQEGIAVSSEDVPCPQRGSVSEEVRFSEKVEDKAPVKEKKSKK